MGNQHADTGPRNSRGSAGKAIVMAVACLIAGVSFLGLSVFGTSMWIAYAVMSMIEFVVAVGLVISRWTNRPASVVVAILAAFQAGQSYVYEQRRYSANDPVIPIDNLGVVILCIVVVSLIAAGPSWTVRRPDEQ